MAIAGKDEQLFVYQEDVQGYWHNHVLMAQRKVTRRVRVPPITGLFAIIRPEQDRRPTQVVKKWFSVETLERLSWQVPGAGQFSASVEKLILAAKENGLGLRLIKRRRKSKAVPKEWSSLPLVKGATGSY